MTKKQEMGRELDPLRGMEIKEVTTRKDSPWTRARRKIEVAIKEQGLRDDARVANSGKRYR